MNREKKPLYRKVNTTAHIVHHNKGGDASNDRNSKEGISEKMKQGKLRGLDYTPLYRFLLSKVGEDYTAVHSEAVSRLKGADISQIDLIVIDINDVLVNKKQNGYCITSESSYHSTLYVDENNKLQLVNPNLSNEDFSPSCKCCTHTFNGKPFVKKYNPNVVGV